MTRFEKAWDEFLALPGVNADAFYQTKVSDLVAAAQFELDIYSEGQIELTLKEVKQFKKFIEEYEDEP